MISLIPSHEYSIGRALAQGVFHKYLWYLMVNLDPSRLSNMHSGLVFTELVIHQPCLPPLGSLLQRLVALRWCSESQPPQLRLCRIDPVYNFKIYGRSKIQRTTLYGFWKHWQGTSRGCEEGISSSSGSCSWLFIAFSFSNSCGASQVWGSIGSATYPWKCSRPESYIEIAN